MSPFFKTATITAVLLIGGATIALSQTVPAPQAGTSQQKGEANDPSSGGVARPDKGAAGPSSSPGGTSQASKDKSKMDDPSSGSVPDKGGAATGPASGSGGISKDSKNKLEGDDPQSGGRKK